VSFLTNLLHRLRRSGDERALERAEGESHMTEHERDVDRGDYEARKDDAFIAGDFAGGETVDAAGEDLSAP